MRNKILILLTFLLGFTYRILISFQGADNVDVGFCNTFYQLIFTNPETNVFNFIYYLTGIIGGAWETIMGHHGLLGFRILEASTLTAAIGLLFMTFKDNTPLRLLLPAILLSFLFPTCVVSFHYDTLSYLLIAASAFFYSRYTRRHNRCLIFIAGIFIGMSFFARLVNISFLALLTIPIINELYAKKSGGGKSLPPMIAGISFGCIIILTTMLSFRHHTFYIEGLHEALDTLGRSEATHSHSELITRYLYSFINLLIQAVILTVVMQLWIKSRTLPKTYRISSGITLSILIMIIVKTSLPYLTVLACCAMIITIAHYYGISKDRGYIVAIYLILATLLFPLGSDIGIQGIFNWCAGLLIFPAAYSMKAIKRKDIISAITVTYACSCFGAVIKTGSKAYGDTKGRMYSTCIIQPERLNIYTDSAKAVKYRNAIKAINKHIGKERLMLLANQASELYYATQSLPYLGHTQTIIYQGNLLKWRLDERHSRLNALPAVVFLKSDKIQKYEYENRTILIKWMRDNKYKLVYSDGFIEIFNPPADK